MCSDGAYKKVVKNLKSFIFAMCMNTVAFYFINTIRICYFEKIYSCVDNYYLHPRNNYAIVDIVLGTIVAVFYAIIINKFFYYDQLEHDSKNTIKQNKNIDIKIMRKKDSVSEIIILDDDVLM